jgi:hypothetical protein
MVHEDLNKEMDRKAELAQKRRELQKMQLKSPSFLKIMRESIESQNADFIEALNLSPEDAAAFLDILLAEQMASAENTFLLPADQYKPENLSRIIESGTRSNEAYVETARGILSPSQIEKLEIYLDQQLDRMVSNMERTALEYGYTENQEDNTDGQEDETDDED